MYTEAEGIILRQVKTVNGRRILVILTDKFGKISAGTSIPEKGKNKTSLALKPFTKGRYELYKNRDSYNINAAEVVQSYYAIGEDVDKYIAASYVLELADKVLAEDEKADGMYKVLCDFLELLSKRSKDFDTLVIAFQIKMLSLSGLSLSQNPLIEGQSDDKIRVVNFVENHSLSSLENLAIPAEMASGLSSFLKKYIAENLGIENLKSEGLKI